MFDYLKRKLYGFKENDLIDAIEEQKKYLSEAQHIDALKDDSIVHEITDNIVEQTQTNINILVETLNLYLKKYHNISVTPRVSNNMIHNQLPIECSGFVMNVRLKYIDNISSTEKAITKNFMFIQDFYFESYFRTLQKQYLFLKDSKLKQKFMDMYADRMFNQIIKIFEKFDYGATKYIDDKYQTDGIQYNNRVRTIGNIILLIDFYIGTLRKSTEQNKLQILLVDDVSDNGAVTVDFVKKCDNIKVIVYKDVDN